ncbi:uncharacterized protein K441DRAFT_560944, partial [Cenococcum geophilum 1.58]|uniref:uncharacterized protein n=1 Tax=Cenococcum geophilum 1.58 TaxID=794803 RepID=UPI00358DDA75
AAVNGHGEVVQLLLGKGANLDYDDGDGRIPLLAAKEQSSKHGGGNPHRPIY